MSRAEGENPSRDTLQFQRHLKESYDHEKVHHVLSLHRCCSLDHPFTVLWHRRRVIHGRRWIRCSATALDWHRYVLYDDVGSRSSGLLPGDRGAGNWPHRLRSEVWRRC